MPIEDWERTEAERFYKMSATQLRFHIEKQRHIVQEVLDAVGLYPPDPFDARRLYDSNRVLLAMEAAYYLKRGVRSINEV